MNRNMCKPVVPDCRPSPDEEGDMTERASGELLDQAICAVHSESYHVRNAALLVIRKYMQHNEEHAFRVCRIG